MGSAVLGVIISLCTGAGFGYMWVQHRLTVYRDLLRHTAYQRILRKHRRGR